MFSYFLLIFHQALFFLFQYREYELGTKQILHVALRLRISSEMRHRVRTDMAPAV